MVRFNGRAFLNIASIGFDAEIIRDLHRIKRFVKGKAAYVLSVFAKFITYKSKEIELILDGRKIKTRAFLTAICKDLLWRRDDDKPQGLNYRRILDVILIKPVPRYKIRFF